MSVKASYSSWNSVKMHARSTLLDALKGELGFRGFRVSDWLGVDQIAESYEESVVSAITTGVDMVVIPLAWRHFIRVMLDAMGDGRISMARIDDAVRRILVAKSWLKELHPDAEGTLFPVGHGLRTLHTTGGHR